MKKILLIICALLLIPISVHAQGAELIDKKCDSENKDIICLNIPIGGLDRIGIGPSDTSFGTYLQNWYTFIIGSIGVIATVMMMWGGFKWLTSRGNSGTISDAKQIIWSALTGVVLAFLSYSILYFINPATTSIGLPKVTSYKSVVKIPNFETLSGSHGDVSQSNQPGQTTTASAPICTSNDPVALDYSQVPAKNNCTVSNEHKAIISQSTGDDPKLNKILESIMSVESSCGKNNQRSSANAYGVMQMLPSTAREILKAQGDPLANSSDQEIGQALQSNDELSIQLSFQYVSNEINNGITDPADIFAGYNAGAATSEGKALGPSRDCAGARAYECCKDPGGLVQTQNYVNQAMGQYNDLSQ